MPRPAAKQVIDFAVPVIAILFAIVWARSATEYVAAALLAIFFAGVAIQQSAWANQPLVRVFPPLARFANWSKKRFNTSVTRGVSSLEHLAHDERDAVVRRIMADRHSEVSGMTVAIAVVMVPAIFLVISMLCPAAARVITSRLGFPPNHGAQDVSMLVLSLLAVSTCAATWSNLRRAHIRKLVRESVEESLGRCTRCRYDLAALREQGPVVTCPECGMANRFDSWTEGYAALIAKKGASHTPPPSAHAAESLAAQPLATGANSPHAQAPAAAATSPDPSPPR